MTSFKFLLLCISAVIKTRISLTSRGYKANILCGLATYRASVISMSCLKHLVYPWISLARHKRLVVAFRIIALSTFIKLSWFWATGAGSVRGPCLGVAVGTGLTLLGRRPRSCSNLPHWLPIVVDIRLLSASSSGWRYPGTRRESSKVLSQCSAWRVSIRVCCLWTQGRRLQTSLNWYLPPVHIDAVLVVFLRLQNLVAQPRVSMILISWAILSISLLAIIFVYKIGLVGDQGYDDIWIRKFSYLMQPIS